MPGRSPATAVTAFLEPLQSALACVAQAKLSVRRGGRSPAVGQEQQWSINDGGGVVFRCRNDVLAASLELFASMWWKVVPDERPDYGPFRVTTTGYDYSMVRNETEELWALHWHPSGSSTEVKPHLHLGGPLLAENAPVTSATHLRLGRMTFETGIRSPVLPSGHEHELPSRMGARRQPNPVMG